MKGARLFSIASLLVPLAIAMVISHLDSMLACAFFSDYICTPKLSEDELDEDEYCPKRVGNSRYFFDIRRQAWQSISHLFDDLDTACDWGWFSVENFAKQSKDWAAKLKDIEGKYVGHLPEPYSLDKEIKAVKLKHYVFRTAYQKSMVLKTDHRVGSKEIAELYKLSAKYSSFLTIRSHIKPSIQDVGAKISLLQTQYQTLSERVRTVRYMSPPLRELFERLEIVLKRNLENLREIAEFPRHYDHQEYWLSLSCS